MQLTNLIAQYVCIVKTFGKTKNSTSLVSVFEKQISLFVPKASFDLMLFALRFLKRIKKLQNVAILLFLAYN